MIHNIIKLTKLIEILQYIAKTSVKSTPPPRKHHFSMIREEYSTKLCQMDRYEPNYVYFINKTNENISINYVK